MKKGVKFFETLCSNDKPKSEYFLATLANQQCFIDYFKYSN